jgi:signal transduction histidine kinase
VAELDRRVPEPPGDDEIARLAVTMNAMLERLERSVSRQQRFVADASHELRTPLTRMRAELEVDDNDPANADPAATRRSQLDEIVGLQQMLEDLLILARSDAGTPDRAAGPVDLDDIVLEELRSRPPTSVTIDASRVSAAQVVGDAGQLRRVVRNLVDNAARHGRSSVVIELAEVGTSAILTVTDDGPGIPPERRAEVFKRFARLDESRTGDAGGAGLGLAIVHDIVSRHGGTIDVGEGPAGGARFVVTLPTDAQGVDGAAR